MRILLTTTSYQDTPGAHHKLLEKSGFEVVRARGPLTEAQMLELVEDGEGFDGFLNGDDQITARVIDAALPRLKTIAKYGIGLDSIDVDYASEKKIPVLFTPGVNHTTVAEHTIALMVAAAKHFWTHLSHVKQGSWKRVTGNELYGKTLGVVGLGRIGREVVKRASAFGMNIVSFNPVWEDAFAAEYHVERAESINEVLEKADFVSLHCMLTDETRHLINKESIARMKDGAFLINTARGGIIVENDVAEACKSGKLAGYAADVLEEEPMKTPHPFQDVDNVLITPHIGSRTYESVERQALRATNNIINFLTGSDDFIQANKF